MSQGYISLLDNFVFFRYFYIFFFFSMAECFVYLLFVYLLYNHC